MWVREALDTDLLGECSILGESSSSWREVPILEEVFNYLEECSISWRSVLFGVVLRMMACKSRVSFFNPAEHSNLNTD